MHLRYVNSRASSPVPYNSEFNALPLFIIVVRFGWYPSINLIAKSKNLRMNFLFVVRKLKCKTGSLSAIVVLIETLFWFKL